MKIQFRWLLALMLISVSAFAPAQVPQLISYQGRVSSNGTNFHGVGQFKFALVDGAGAEMFWSNDGSGSAGAVPAGAVALNVNQGLLAVFLGDTSLSNMTPISSGVFVTNSDVRLRIWFSDGGAFQRLSPDQRIVSVGYAMMAANVADGSISDRHLATGGALSPTRLKVGVNQTFSGNLSTIAGGSNNAVTADSAAIAGGQNNRVTDNFGVVTGGANNQAGNADGTLNNAPFATVSGGQQNAATEDYATVAGGWTNTASGFASIISGGRENLASGSYATVPGGQRNRAMGNNSMAAGTRAQANHRGSFVWADSTDADFVSSTNDTFLIRAANGVGINTSNPAASLDVNGSGRVRDQMTVDGRLGVKTASPVADLDVAGSGHFASGVIVQGPIGSGGNVTVGTAGTPADLIVSGSSSLVDATVLGPARLGSDLTVNGAVTLHGQVAAKADVVVGDPSSPAGLVVHGSGRVANQLEVGQQLVLAGQIVSAVPVGAVMEHAGTNAPLGWLLCDGAAVGVSNYPALFAALGTSWGGDGSNTFRVPNLQGVASKGTRMNEMQGLATGLIEGDTRFLNRELGLPETVSISDDGRYIAFPSSRSNLVVRDFTGNRSQLFSGHTDKIRTVVYLTNDLFCGNNPESDYVVATGSDDKTIKLWGFDRSTGVGNRLLMTLTGHTGPIYALVEDHEHRMLISFGYDRTIRFWSFTCVNPPSYRLNFTISDDTRTGLPFVNWIIKH